MSPPCLSEKLLRRLCCSRAAIHSVNTVIGDIKRFTIKQSYERSTTVGSWNRNSSATVGIILFVIECNSFEWVFFLPRGRTTNSTHQRTRHNSEHKHNTQFQTCAMPVECSLFKETDPGFPHHFAGIRKIH